MAEQILLSTCWRKALRSLPPGSEIVVGAHALHMPNGVDEVELVVSDHGPGVPEEARPHLRGVPGGRHAPIAAASSLGLAIVRALIVAHGGSICTRDTRRRGHVRVYVPAGGPRRVTTILLVEDDPALRPHAPHDDAQSRSRRPRRRHGPETVHGRVERNSRPHGPRPRAPRHRRPRSAAPRPATFSAMPVIVLTAHHQQSEKIRALDAGADDYVTKPFDTEELLAEVPATLRRVPQSSPIPTLVRWTAWRSTSRAGASPSTARPVHLTRTELALLEILVSHPGKLLTQEFLLREVWGQGYGSESNYLPRVRRTAAQETRRRRRASAPHPDRARHRIPMDRGRGKPRVSRLASKSCRPNKAHRFG